MLHCIQIFMNTCEVTMQVKDAIVSTLFGMNSLFFPNVIKAILHGFDFDIHI